jgi:hypothetical protein
VSNPEFDANAAELAREQQRLDELDTARAELAEARALVEDADRRLCENEFALLVMEGTLPPELHDFFMEREMRAKRESAEAGEDDPPDGVSAWRGLVQWANSDQQPKTQRLRPSGQLAHHARTRRPRPRGAGRPRATRHSSRGGDSGDSSDSDSTGDSDPPDPPGVNAGQDARIHALEEWIRLLTEGLLEAVARLDALDSPNTTSGGDPDHD